MTDQYKRALRACNDGLLKFRTDKEDVKLQIFCYTQDCFWGKDTWNDLTKTHRGKLYYEGRETNKPFNKIFNLNEQPETNLDVVVSRMECEEHDIYAKANGHLFIVSAFTDKRGEQHVVFHTKGGLPGPENDLLNDDIKIFGSLYADAMDKLIHQFPNSTWMFEAIVAYDKHTMYSNEVELYGSENCFVLLGMNLFSEEEEWNEADYAELELLADYIGCPVIKRYESVNGTPDQWLDHKDTEGYIIRFKNGDRVKIKTKEYWGIRFKKDLSAERILAMFKKSGDGKIRNKLPEEVAEEILFILDASYQSWWYNVHVEMPKIGGMIFAAIEQPLSTEERADLFKDDTLTVQQKQTIAAVSDGKKPIEMIWNSKQLRSKFYDWMIEDPDHIKPFEESLHEVVDNM